MVMDDDILISAADINRLFELRARYGLWICQPAFSLWGKISHPITCEQPGNILRYTNFVELTCPVFLREKLDEFMHVYDPVLVGYGIDYWFLHVLGIKSGTKVAVIDRVRCINPRDRFKGGLREIDRLQPTAERIKVWQEIKARHGITREEEGYKEFGAVRATGFWDRISGVLSWASVLSCVAIRFTWKGIVRLRDIFK
ncbi:MAG: hypothetical protein BWY42_01533 [Candidatus Omnitrophica bacterium ADurb.Bin277]|nr:MAG: hypothetical protein BWY42_01533 [Candidatus Omnitrophica bacterium ADurb.Bin277]